MRKYRKYGVEEWMLIICGVAIMFIIVYFLTACTKAQKVSDFDIIWHKNECLFHAKGMSIEQAEALKNEWIFTDCEVKVDDSEDETIKPRE